MAKYKLLTRSLSAILIAQIVFQSSCFFTAYANNNNEEINIGGGELEEFIEDINKDGVIDVKDISLVGIKYNLTSQNEEFPKSIDINNDGIIDLYDLVYISKVIGLTSNDLVYKVYYVNDSGENVLVGQYKTQEEAKSIAKEYDYGLINNYRNNTVWNNKFVIYQINESNQSKTVLGEYDKFSEAKVNAENLKNTYIHNGMQEEIWNNNFEVYQLKENGSKVYVGKYENETSALTKANTYTHSSVISPDSGEEIWNNGYPGKMLKEVNVMSGPGIEYESIGKVFLNEEVAVLNIENEYLHIEYSILNNTNRKRGYVPVANVKTEYIANNINSRMALFSNTVLYSKMNQDVLGAPSDTATKIGSVWEQEDVIGLQQDQNYTLIEYKTSNGKKRGYVRTNNLSSTPTVVIGVVSTTSLNLNVRAQANTTSAILGKLSNGTKVEVVDLVNSQWCKIKYGSGFGYVSREYISLKTISGEMDGYVTTNGSNLNVRATASSSATILGRLSNGTKITIVDDSNSSWYKIKYGSSYGYVSKEYVSTTPTPSKDPGENVKPNLRSSYYNNGFSRGQCTWYTWGRAWEKLGVKLPQENVKGYTGVAPNRYPPTSFRNNAKHWWYDNLALNKMGKGYKYGSTPKANSIIVWTRGTYGHVAFVEKVDGDRVYISESNYDGKGSYRAKWWTLSQIKTAAKSQTYGYIYLE